MSFLKQIFFIALIGVAIFAGVELYEHLMPSQAATSEGRGRGPTAVETAKSEMRPIVTTIEAVGTTIARRSVDITPLTSGRIATINVQAGDRVGKGDLLVELDSDFEEADLAQARASLKEAELALERAVTLRKNNNVAQATVDEWTAKRAAAQAAVNRATRKLSDRRITAPFSGTVGIIDADVGARVDDKTKLTHLDDLEQVEVQFSVPEQQFSVVRAGYPVVARSEAFPGVPFKGRVSEIDSRVDQASRSFRVRAVIPNGDRRLPAGMFMLVSLVLEEEMALMVPEEAVVPQGDKSFVWVARDGKALRREVALERRKPGFVEVVGGLEESEEVIVKGTGQVRQGAPIRLAGEDGGGPGAERRGGRGQPR